MAQRDKFHSEFKKIRPSILIRDENRCAKCGSDLSLEVHHIDGYDNNSSECLVTLCYLCHAVAPMGKDLFSQWLLLGRSGIEEVQTEIKGKKIPRMTKAQIVEFCRVLLKFNIDLAKERMKAARDRMRGNGTYKEGRKPYGEKPGEAAVLERMLKMREIGKHYYQIADELNAEGIPCRRSDAGKIWSGNTIQKILARKSAEKA